MRRFPESAPFQACEAPGSETGVRMDADSIWRLWRSPAAIETVKTIVYALLIVSFILTFIFRPYVIPSSSMKDTLLVGDYVFVTKLTHRALPALT